MIDGEFSHLIALLMLANTLYLLAFLALTVGVIWLTLRARRLQGAALKWAAIGAGGLFSLILLLVSGLGTKGMFNLYSPRGRPVRAMSIERTPERVARGQHIANAWCANCHSLNGEVPLSGGKNLSDEAHMPLGDLYTINLTPAGPLKDWTDGEIFRAVREGADKNGKRLPVMSAQRVRNLSDEDLSSVVAYIRSQPAVQHETPPPNPSFLLAMMVGAGLVPSMTGLPPENIQAPTPGPTAEYGKYIVGWIGCDECHGASLTGGGGGVVPKAPTLRTVKGWTREGFITALRTGKTPFGKQINGRMMPYKQIGRLSDDELSAIYAYLNTLN
jgi:mono/diheme cytochrome c family protein